MIQKLPPQFETVYRKYADADRLRGDFRYLEAMHSLAELYRRMGGNFEMLDSVAELIITEYEGKESQVTELLRAGEYSQLSRVVREMQSSVRQIVDENTLRYFKEMQDAAAAKNDAQVRSLWAAVHAKLEPIFGLLRQLREARCS
ncbi:MAG: hypothetical protein U0136_08850 [Bdellovibrionota bacterium]